MAKEEMIEFKGKVTELLPNATFRVKLVNGADFYLIYQGKDEDKALFVAQVAGKKYFLESLPEEQQASEAIARLLRYN